MTNILYILDYANFLCQNANLSGDYLFRLDDCVLGSGPHAQNFLEKGIGFPSDCIQVF